MDRTGPRLPLVLGPAIAGVGFAMFALPGVGAGGWLSTLAPMVVLGVGMGLTVTPLTTTVMNAVDVSHAGIASGINNAVSRASGLIAVAAIGAPLQAMAAASSSGFRGVALAAAGLAMVSAAIAAGTLDAPGAPEQRAAA
jgi:MFS family permease